MFRYLIIFVILTAVGILYERYKSRFLPAPEIREHDLIKRYLLNGSTGFGVKPILWIHLDHEVNQRWWPSFYSRDTTRLNQPYVVSCIQSIVKHCGSGFDVCLIDDDSFGKLIPGWSVDLDKVGDPVRSHLRLLALSKLLYYFGGLLLPKSTIVTKSLLPVYDTALLKHSCFTTQMINRANTATYSQLFPSHKIIGCTRNSPVMREFMLFLERINSTDHTDEMDFLGQADRWLFKACSDGRAKIVSGRVFGTLDKRGSAVGIDKLMGNTFIDFDTRQLRAIYVPADEILRRTKYQWFARLSQEQLRTCDAIVARQLLLAQS